ncbi:MAG: hypothetical protein GDA41_01385 [Rhodospirillales bacterium]|nr:hypothetical protein [Rhodospirillales bacterium]
MQEIIVADTSVLINFLRVDRMDLIGRHPASFVATDHAAAEIEDSDQKRRYVAAVSMGHLAECRVEQLDEVRLFARLSRGGRLGSGECSAIAAALKRNYRLAIDDNCAIKHAREEAERSGHWLSIVRTQDIVVELIRNRVLTVQQADAMLADWASNHRFRLKIRSFNELL